MRKQRFPFQIVSPRVHRDEPDGFADRVPRIMSSLSLIESSLDELLEAEKRDAQWRDFFLALLPILDGIGGLRDAVEKTGDPSWRRGMEIVTAKLETLLSSRGLERLGRVGELFDAGLHRAAGARREARVPAGCIAEIVEDGWALRGVALRPATVIVSREDA